MDEFLYKYMDKYSICLVKEYKQLCINICRDIYYQNGYGRRAIHSKYLYKYFSCNDDILHRLMWMLDNGDDYSDEFSNNTFKYIISQRNINDDLFLIESRYCNSDKIFDIYHSKDDIFYYKHIKLYKSLFKN